MSFDQSSRCSATVGPCLNAQKAGSVAGRMLQTSKPKNKRPKGSKSRVKRSKAKVKAVKEVPVMVEHVQQLKDLVQEEMDQMECGYFHNRTVAILGLGNVADSVEILAIGYILTVYEESDGKMTRLQSSCLAAAIFAGMLCGSILGGFFGDIYGRKAVLSTSLFLNALASFCSALAPSIFWLTFFRMLAGVGVGGVSSSMFALCLEHVPTRVRGRYVTILCAFWMVGSVGTAGTAWIMLGNDSDGNRILNLSWRYFAAVVGLPSLSCFFLTLAFVPESSQFLASRGDIVQVNDVLKYIHQVNDTKHRVYQFVNDKDDDEKLVGIVTVSNTAVAAAAAVNPEIKLHSVTTTAAATAAAAVVVAASGVKGSSPSDESKTTSSVSAPLSSGALSAADSPTANATPMRLLPLSARCWHANARRNVATRWKLVVRLFRGSFVKTTCILLCCGFCLSFGSYGLSSWITMLFKQVGLSNPFANGFLFAGSNLPGNLISFLLVDRIGRKRLLAGSFFASACCSLLFAWNVEGSRTVVVFVSCLFNACTTAAWNGFGVLNSESFPLEVRTTGMAIVACSVRFGAISSQFVNGYLVGPPPHIEALLLVVSSIMLVGGTAASQASEVTDGEGANGSLNGLATDGYAIPHEQLQEESVQDQLADEEQMTTTRRKVTLV